MELTAKIPGSSLQSTKLLLNIEEKGNFPLTVVRILGVPFYLYHFPHKCDIEFIM